MKRLLSIIVSFQIQWAKVQSQTANTTKKYVTVQAKQPHNYFLVSSPLLFLFMFISVRKPFKTVYEWFYNPPKDFYVIMGILVSVLYL